MIDLLWSCAMYAIISPTPCIRPEFSDTTAIKQGVNPLVQSLNSRDPFIPNDVYLHGGGNFVVITGPNMVPNNTIFKTICSAGLCPENIVRNIRRCG